MSDAIPTLVINTLMCGFIIAVPLGFIGVVVFLLAAVFDKPTKGHGYKLQQTPVADDEDEEDEEKIEVFPGVKLDRNGFMYYQMMVADREREERKRH